MRVGLFDSGIGGLTVLKTLIKKYPNNDYIYFGDTKNLPYGSKNKDELMKLARGNIEFLLRFNVDIIIVACGTVSSNCVDYLRDLYDVKIVDIISPTIDYLNYSDYNNVLVMATEATVDTHIFRDNINKIVVELPTPKLVPLIESGNLDNIDTVLNDYLSDYLDKTDILVLGCTHYPLLLDNIRSIVPTDTSILDMSRLVQLDDYGNGSLNIYFSKVDGNLSNNVKNILGREVTINEVNIN